MVNTGNAHLVVGQLALRDQAAAEDAPAAVSLKASTPVFPGQRHQWLLQPDRPLPENIRLDVTTDREVQRVPVELDGG
jgi:hypothetical protein